MANYINDEILCEAYTHLAIDLFGDKAALTRLKANLTSFMDERAKFFLGEDVYVKVTFEDGSLKTKVTVLGTAALIITSGITAYGSFRAGIDQITKDATMLAQGANQELIFRTKTAYCDRINIEKRKGVFGRVDALLNELDVIMPVIADPVLPTKPGALKAYLSSVDKLIEWDNRADTLLNKLSSVETEECVAAGLLEELEKMPDSAPWTKQLKSRSSLRSSILQADVKRASDLEAAAAKYAVIIDALRDKMSSRVKKNSPKRT